MDESELVQYVFDEATENNIVIAKYLGFNPDYGDLYEIQIPNGEAFSFTIEEIMNIKNDNVTLVIE